MARWLLGVIRDFDNVNYVADVEVSGAVSTLLVDVPVAWHIDGAHPTDGTACVVLLADELHVDEALVVACFGGAPPP
jgi:hypothetical protein